jgi:hypothetical protein
MFTDGFPTAYSSGLCSPSVRDKDEKGGQWPSVGSPTEPGTPAAGTYASRARFRGSGAGRRPCARGSEACPQGFDLCTQGKSLVREAKSLARGALSLGRELSAPARRVGRRLRLGGDGDGPDLGLAGEAGGHAVPERVQARAFAGHLEQGIALQRRAHHVAAERRLTIVDPFQQPEEARGARTELVELSEIVLRVGEIEAQAGGGGCSGPAP